MSEKTLADRLFEAERTHMLVEEEAHDAVCRAFGIDPDDTATWPHEDWKYDYYDGSFELLYVKPGWKPSRAQEKAAYALGFFQFWLVYRDGTEAFYCGGHRA